MVPMSSDLLARYNQEVRERGKGGEASEIKGRRGADGREGKENNIQN